MKHKTPHRKLRVPHLTQPGGENTCMIHSLWMVNQYMSNVYPQGKVRDCVTPLSTEDIKEAMSLNEMGWTSSQDELDDVSEESGCIRFKLWEWDKLNSPTSDTLFNKIEENLNEDLPLIVVVDLELLENGRKGKGPQHSVVVTGMENNEVYINDSFNGTHYPVKKGRFARAWDTVFNRIIEVEFSKNTRQSTIQEAEESNAS